MKILEMESTPSFNFQSTLLSLRSGASIYPFAEEIKAIIHHAEAKKLRISFCWVPGHVGIVGRERQMILRKRTA